MRRFTGVALGAVALSSLALVTPSRDAPAEAAELPTLQAHQADQVVDAYGVGIHLNFLDTPYADATKVADALSALGVRHVRDDLFLEAPRQYAAIRTVADRGIDFNLIMGRPDRPGTPEDHVRTVATQLPPDAVESLEGVNEWDLFGGGLDWPTEMFTWQQRLHAATKSTPETAHLPVLAPALAFRWNATSAATAGDISPYADKANAHMYPGGYQPSNEIANITTAIRTLVPTKPLVVTEAGYHNAMSTTNGHLPVPEDVAGVYMPRLLLDHVMRGHERVYSYELIDEFADDGNTNPEANFGLLRRDWSPKPAYTAMKTMIGLLSDPGPAFTPEPLPLQASGWPSDGKHLLTQKRNGEYVLLMWRDARIYDPVLRQRTPVPSANVTLQLGQDYDLGVYRPTAGAEPVSESTGSSVSLQLGPEVTALTLDEVTAAEVAPEPEPEPEPTVLAEPAPAPTSVTATAGNGTATIGWQLPSTSANVTGFEVTRNPGGVKAVVDSTARSYRDTGLVNGTAYTYSVRALSPDGSSSTVTSPTVVPATTPSAPTIVKTVARKGSVTVTWKKPNDGGKAILGYQLTSGTKSVTFGPNATEGTISGLKGSVQVGVRARNELGYGVTASTPYVRAKKRR